MADQSAMTHQASPRRTFLGNVLSGAAALWVSATGVLSTVLAACEPTAKYGGPPPEAQPTVPIGTVDEPGSSGDSHGDTGGADGTEAADGGTDPTASADPPAPVPKYGGPPPEPVTVKYGGPPGPSPAVPKYGGPVLTPPPPIVAKYGGPPMTTKYGGPRKYGGPDGF